MDLKMRIARRIGELTNESKSDNVSVRTRIGLEIQIQRNKSFVLPWSVAFVAVCWLIWKERNTRVFRNKRQPVQCLVPRILQLIDLWLKHCKQQICFVGGLFLPVEDCYCSVVHGCNCNTRDSHCQVYQKKKKKKVSVLEIQKRNVKR